MSPKKSEFYETTQRALQKARFMRDRHLKSIADVHSLALMVEGGTVEPCELELRVDSFHESVSKFRQEQESIVESLIVFDRVDEFDELDEPVCKTMDDMYLMVKRIISRLSPECPATPKMAAPIFSSLPKIELPKFDGNVLLWRPFRDTFISLVHKNQNICDIQRFHYLLTCVTGSALSIIKTVPLSAANYKLAWGALLERFENQRLLATAHVDKLFTFKPIVHESLPALSSFVNTFQENTAALKELGIENLAGFLLFHIASKALDSTTRREFETNLPPNKIPTFDNLLSFVQQKCQILENIQGLNKGQWTERNVGKGKPQLIARSFLATSERKGNATGRGRCIFCKEAHAIYRCPAFQRATVDKRRDFTQNNKLCFSCLSSSHFVNNCSSKSSCRTCHKRHHSLLHISTTPSEDATTTNSDSPTPNTEMVASSETPTMFSGTLRNKSTVVLGTAIVHVQDHYGVSHVVRVLVDSGSQVTAMTADCASRLNLSILKHHANIVGIAQNPVSRVKGMTKCTLIPHHSQEPVFKCEEVLILPNITAPMPAEPLPVSIRNLYKHLMLADPAFDSPMRIDMLLGSDIFPHIICPRAGIIHNSGFPSALETFFGWIIVGTITNSCHLPYTSLTVTTSPLLNQMLRQFWTVEEPSVPEHPTTEDALCENWFVKTVSRDSSGRFCVALPFRDNVMPVAFRSPDNPTISNNYSTTNGLGDSRSLALKRLFNLERRLTKDVKLYDAYRKFMNEYLSLGHMKLATEPGKYFIPHHAVMRQEGDLSKLRVVFDASASSSSGVSLNDVLCIGPKLQVDIKDILLKCRLKRYMFTADIEKMYRQILVRSADCLYQHILWRNDPMDEVQEFELLTVTYGVNAAPYLAIRCLHELDTQQGFQFPAAKGILIESTYVDDIVVGADTEDEILQKQDHIIRLLRAGGCKLKKWTSNCHSIFKRLSSTDRTQLLSLDPKDDCSVKVLGLHWDTLADNFGYHTNITESLNSKRGVLSAIARLYDPIGALGPTILWAKCFMQELWQNKLEWDEPLPISLLSTWKQFISELSSINQIALSRYIDLQNCSDIQLLGFSDASLRGYAATAYLRIKYLNNHIKVYFLATKTKVSPLKAQQTDTSLSVPRLELCAALLLAQLLEKLQNVLGKEIHISRVRAWTDSSVVLSWLTADQKVFKIFVTNRIAKIHALIPSCVWSHVSTTENPADPPSRGLLPEALVSCSLHWEGPRFLRLSEDKWPEPRFTQLTEDQLPDVKAIKTKVLTLHDTPIDDYVLLRFSSWQRLQRSMAYVLRFVYSGILKQPLITGPLKLAELSRAVLVAIRLTQKIHFPELIKQLQDAKRAITPSSVAQLAPFIDVNGLIRVGGRLQCSLLSEDAKHPLLLPKSSHVTSLLIRFYHLSYLHAGPKLILSMIRQRFWILSARDAIRRSIFTCVTCTRHRAQHPKPVMGNLPISRVQPHRPFLHVGMDYGGPFLVKASRYRKLTPTKIYLALFICMSVKAVHVEIVSDLSTEAFLAALDRFVARRGIPSDLYSDCGTNYVGAARQLKSLFENEVVQNKVSTHIPCNWHFNPPAAPHFGGLWEAAIKSFKFHLKRVIGIQVLTYEEFLTLAARIESILNSRPLTPLSSDPNDLNALTPGHFLIGQPLSTLPETNTIHVPMNRLTRWQLIRQMHQSFWKRWAHEYLSNLQVRQKWTKKDDNLQIGDLVIVEAPTRPPTEWRLGRVINTHPGQDKVVRVVTVKTLDGEFKRPVVKLTRLPAEA